MKLKTGKYVNCLYCKKSFYIQKCFFECKKYCSKICYIKSMFGKKLSSETKKKMSESRKGKKYKPWSLERRINFGNLMKGRKPWNKGLKTKPLSIEHRMKISKALIGKKMKKKIKCGKYFKIRVNGLPILEHRAVVEKAMNRTLLKNEVVHHVNRNKHDNRLCNLIVFKNGVWHFWHHKKPNQPLKGVSFDGRYYTNSIKN